MYNEPLGKGFGQSFILSASGRMIVRRGMFTRLPVVVDVFQNRAIPINHK